MRLGEKQELFSRLYSQHIVWLNAQGYEVRMGDVFAHDGHKENSNHYLKLAGDINLFKDGKFLTKTEEHRESGEKWKSRHPLCRWGGDFSKVTRKKDGNHYSLIHRGRK